MTLIEERLRYLYPDKYKDMIFNEETMNTVTTIDALNAGVKSTFRYTTRSTRVKVAVMTKKI